MPSSGYLVVEGKPQTVNAAGELLFNLRYRGLDRMPPFSQELFDQGFRDPYLFLDSKGPDGLIIDLSLARHFRAQLSEVHRLTSLEIVRADEIADGMTDAPLPEGHLGYDVAGGRPFWSPVGDPPDDSTVRRFLIDHMNDNGLLPSARDGFDYLSLFRRVQSLDAHFKVWSVSAIE
jgi:hypothetical protein